MGGNRQYFNCNDNNGSNVFQSEFNHVPFGKIGKQPGINTKGNFKSIQG